MRDMTTMLWKEATESLSNRRFLVVFAIVSVAVGVLPALSFAHAHSALARLPEVLLLRAAYGLFAAVIVAAQTAPDLVLHERVGHTLDYLLTTRLPDRAIFGSKVILAASAAYLAALLAVAVQLVAASLLGHAGWQWLFLATAQGRIAVLGISAALSLYLAVVGTFVALRVGEQRTAYLVTMLSLAIIVVPLVAGWIQPSLTATWIGRATLVFAGVALLLALVGGRWFRRDMLVLYLQE